MARSSDDLDAVIQRLGGLTACPDVTLGTAPLRDAFLAAHGLALDEAFLHLTSRWGGGSFAQDVEVVAAEPVPVARPGRRISVGRLLGWHPGWAGIPHIREAYADQIPSVLLPFAEAGSGDFLCLGVPGDDDHPADEEDDDDGLIHDRADELCARRGAIWYWHHEAPEGDDVFLVADSLDDFLAALRVRGGA